MTDLLKPYQLAGADWLRQRERGYLADPPGLGKTRQLLMAALLVGAKRILVIAPAVALAHWHREFVLVFGPMPGVVLMVASYQKFVMSAQTRDEVNLFYPEVVILDEAHMLKHRDSARTLGILFGTWLDRAPHIWPASGTPMPRNPYELYPVVSALWGQQMHRELGITSHDQWRDRFTFWKWGDYGPKVYASRNVDQLRAFLRGKMLRRREADVLPELPPIRWTAFPLSVTPATESDAWSLTNELSHADRIALSTPDRAPTGSVASARRALGLMKVPYALDLIRREMDDEPRSKRIVFAYHRDVLEKLRIGLGGYGIAYIDGSVSGLARARAEYAFQNDPTIRVFLGQNEAAGLSLTLTAASRVDLVEPDWRTDMNVQDGKRAHRIGQDKSVLVRMLSMADTLDEALVNQHWRETKMRAEVIG